MLRDDGGLLVIFSRGQVCLSVTKVVHLISVWKLHNIRVAKLMCNCICANLWFEIRDGELAMA